MDLHSPTKLIFGKNSEERIGEILQQSGIKSIMLVYGTSSAKSSGLYSKIVSTLKNTSIDFHDAGGFDSNPILSHAEDAVIKGRENSIEAVVSVGGGSAIDAGKAIAAAIYSNTEIQNLAKNQNIKGSIPHYTIVTLSGSGSEVNSKLSLTDDKTGIKFTLESDFFYPTLAVINPELTLSVPPNYTAFNSILLFSRIFTNALSSRDTDIRELMNLIDLIENILIHPDNYDYRAEFSQMVLKNSTSQTSLLTRLTEKICGKYNIPYGAALSMIFPAWIKYNRGIWEERVTEINKGLFNIDDYNEGMEALETWLHQLGSPVRLSEYNIDIKDIETEDEDEKNILILAN